MPSSSYKPSSVREEYHDTRNLEQQNGRRHRKKFVLCFDGTGNKFSGTDADSNILKIYRCLDRSAEDQFHYYQPGIGTYVAAKSLNHTGRFARLKSWYMKAKDSAIGTSFADHVMGGYKFLMRYYTPGDEIYLFGFSRGAYTARFLAEMLDHVGILSAGNEEMARFAWKTFQKWQIRRDRTEEEKEEKRKMLDYMCAFRETFSRPVHRIRFLGLFDTVNSVPRFENAWMQRSKFPYTARSTAKVIRHAVAIDERRAKFRQDLISEVRRFKTHLLHHHSEKNDDQEHHHHHGPFHKGEIITIANNNEAKEKKEEQERGRKASVEDLPPTGLFPPAAFRDKSETSGIRSLSVGSGSPRRRHLYEGYVSPSASQTSLQAIKPDVADLSDGEGEQDIKEVWFPGCHADIGGGWELNEDEDASLSHVPLVWMIHEAQKAGLQFDGAKLRALNCCPDEIRPIDQHMTEATIPRIAIQSPRFGSQKHKKNTKENDNQNGERRNSSDSESDSPPGSHFHEHLLLAATRGNIHDVLRFNNGVSTLGVISWNIMEYLPFRRMDLQPDGSWRSISWPLPKGEVRDMPDDAIVHNSALRRMEHDPTYRPGNLICGGGGRGVRRAPEELGIGKWNMHSGEGDPIAECVVRAEKPKRKETDQVTPISCSPGGPAGMWIGSN